MKTNYSLLNFSSGEFGVVGALQAGHTTPLQISKHTNLSRQGVYKILKNLTQRGLVSEETKGGHSWRLVSEAEFDSVVDATRSNLFGSGTSPRQMIRLYQGKKSVAEVLKRICLTHRNETWSGIQGDAVYGDWVKVLGLPVLNDMNRAIKKNHLTIHAVMPEGNYERAITEMGEMWAVHFEGRTYRANLIGEQYFKHKAEISIFKKKIYLMCLRDELIIEISHPEILKMISLLLQYIQDNSRLVDGNQILRGLLKK